MYASMMEHSFTIYPVIQSYHVYKDGWGRSSLLREIGNHVAILACTVTVKIANLGGTLLI